LIADDGPALRVDEDADAVRGLDHRVVVVGTVGERQLVGESGAAARGHADPEDRQRAALLQGERGDPPSGLVGDRDDVGDGSVHVLPGYPTCSPMPSRAPFTDSDSVG
jgi:hypothetical protein